MKNKKLLYILIPIVLLIWGMISYKIVVNINDDEVFNTQIQLGLKEGDNNNTLVKDSFKLLLDYRDPFLTSYKRSYKRTISSKSSSDGKKKVKELEMTESWPMINYGGMIKQKKSNQKVGLIQINQIDYLIRENEEVSEFKIVRITRDSVVLRRGKLKKTVYQ